MDYDVYEYDEWYWDSIPVDDIYDTAEEVDLMDWDEQQVSLRQIIMYYYITYWSNVDNTWGEDTIFAYSEKGARAIFSEAFPEPDYVIESVEEGYQYLFRFFGLHRYYTIWRI